MVSVGQATLDVVPSMTGFGSRLQRGIMPSIRSVGALAAGAGIGKLVKDSIQLEAQFSKTMNVMQATSGASENRMKSLSDLAMKMGADTVFSANQASEAMLELARGGIRPAEIEAGALQGTLTLAAAGELEMGEAANVAVKAMGQFNLQGKDMGRIASALAGGANASSASVRDMSTALAQGGLAADAVGFSIEETTGILAAFSNAGMEGSDAGTSLKTMLDRLIPASEKAEDVMERLGLQTEAGNNAFVKANGEFESAAVIAERLQTATEDLSSSERKRALSIIFGSDAQRAATILAKEGAEGLRPLIRATSDQGAAQEMANANMEGTAGALERMSGSVETAQLKFGRGLAPAVQKVADKLAEFVDKAPLDKWGENVGDAILNVIGVIEDMTPKVKGFMDAVDDIPPWAIKLATGGAVGLGIASKVNKTLGGGGALGGRGLLGSLKPVPVFVTNPGWDKKPGGDAPGKSTWAATAAKSIAVAAVPVAASLFGSLGINKLQEKVAPKAYDKGVSGTPRNAGFDGLFGPDGLDGAKAKAYNATLERIADTMGSLNQIAPAVAIAASGIDREFASLAKTNPGRAFQLFNETARRSGISVERLSQALPETSKRLRKAGVTTGEWSNRVRALGTDVDKVDRKKPSPKFTFPGLDDGRSKTNKLGGEVDRVGRKKPSPKFTFPGLQEGIRSAGALDRALDEAARDRNATITTRWVDVGRRPDGGRSTAGGVTKRDGGPIRGPGTGTSDDVPIWGSNGEFMMKTAAVDKYGLNFMHRVNALAYAGGGSVGGGPGSPAAAPGFPSRVTVVIDGREFSAYVDERADGRITAHRQQDRRARL